MRIIIGADLVPSRHNYDLFEKGNADDLVGVAIGFNLEKIRYSNI